jgi:hypothetical glycosyl hydrolase
MMKYDLGKGEHRDWIVSEELFSRDYLGKAEAVLSLGNGYMGLRSATEEPYIGETRNLFVSGTFNKFDDFEVSELPNAADVTRWDIRIDGERLDVSQGTVSDYVRALNLKTAELSRRFVWKSGSGKEVAFTFKRFVSLDNLHLIGQKMEVQALNADVEITVESGINAQLTNSGSQHFEEGEKRIYDKRYVELLQRTSQSQIDFVFQTVHHAAVDGQEWEQPYMRIERRSVSLTYKGTVPVGKTLEFEKLTLVQTSRDKEYADITLQDLRILALESIKACAAKGYDALFLDHVNAWKTKVWDHYRVEVGSTDGYDQLSLRFAVYHLVVMTPAHDERMGIGAKGLSGEGYKGHSFWDTEIFILPFFMYANPDLARSLLTYRYLGLDGAHKKALENGYDGAMYPWESAWPSDGEVTPVWGAVDIITGKQTKIWSGFIEQHISADIAFAVWQYYQITGDQRFMDEYGYEILFDTAKFWASRLEWNEEKEQYHITNVIGPDEYKEHISNNAFTNHMVHFNIELAIRYYEELKASKPDVYGRLNEKLNLDQACRTWIERMAKLYLPEPREGDLLIPQDDTYLSLQEIDLTKYKNQTNIGSMFDDYNLEQVNRIQVSKQADVMILFYLLENRFEPEVKVANYNYYEPKTLHDSSLSLSTHSILANDLDDSEMAYRLFRRASEIDLGPNMKTSNHGIHSASIGGIWQATVMGFAGVRMLDGKLRINPMLPKHWNRLAFALYWKGQRLEVEVSHGELAVTATDGQTVTLEVGGSEHIFDRSLNVRIGDGNLKPSIV